jgi:Uma2 family endonuclease
MASATGITIEEFEKLPAALALNHELVDGELIDVSGNTVSHNRLRDILVRLLSPFVEEPKLGLIISEQEFDFGGNAHGPDVSLIGAEKLHLIERGRRVQPFVPDLAIEIVSENDKHRFLMKKSARYRKCGTKEVWVLDPETRTTFVNSEDRQVILQADQMFESKLIPGFAMLLADLFDQALEPLTRQ